MVNVIWTQFAIEDLRLIHEYISNDSVFYADRFVDKKIARINQLENFPKSGRIVSEFNSPTVRELIEGNYRIIYKISKNNSIGIVRIHHAARQLK